MRYFPTDLIQMQFIEKFDSHKQQGIFKYNPNLSNVHVSSFVRRVTYLRDLAKTFQVSPRERPWFICQDKISVPQIVLNIVVWNFCSFITFLHWIFILEGFIGSRENLEDERQAFQVNFEVKCCPDRQNNMIRNLVKWAHFQCGGFGNWQNWLI